MTGSMGARVESHLSLVLQRAGSCSHEAETQTGEGQISAGHKRLLHGEIILAAWWRVCGGRRGRQSL